MNEKLLEMTERSFVLLFELLQASSATQREGDQTRAVFVHRHARNILGLGEDVAFLLESDRADSCPIIVRSILESMFKIGAAVNRENAAISILAYEIQDDIKRIGILTSGILGRDQILLETSTSLKAYLMEIRKKHSLASESDWRVLTCAELAGFPDIYRLDYYLLSKHTHAHVSGLIQQEKGFDPGRLLRIVIFAALAATGRAAPLLGVNDAQRYVDDAALLLDECGDLFSGN